MEVTAYYFSDNDLLRLISTTLRLSIPMPRLPPYLITPETLAWETGPASDWEEIEGVSVIRTLSVSSRAYTSSSVAWWFLRGAQVSKASGPKNDSECDRGIHFCCFWPYQEQWK